MHAVRAAYSGELWSACDIVFCAHLGWEDVIVHEQYLQNNNSFSNKIRNPLWNPLWNPEIHFEIQKFRNPREVQKSGKREIQWISKSRTPRRAVVATRRCWTRTGRAIVQTGRIILDAACNAWRNSLVPRLLPCRKTGREPGRTDHVPHDVWESGFNVTSVFVYLPSLLSLFVYFLARHSYISFHF